MPRLLLNKKSPAKDDALASVWVQRRSRQHLPLSLHQVAAYISTQFFLTGLFKCCAPYILYSYIITRTSRAQLSSFESINIYRQSDHPAPPKCQNCWISLKSYSTMLQIAYHFQIEGRSSISHLPASVSMRRRQEGSIPPFTTPARRISVTRHCSVLYQLYRPNVIWDLTFAVCPCQTSRSNGRL